MSGEEVPTSMAELVGQMSDMVLVPWKGPMNSIQIHQQQPPQSRPKGIVWQGEIEWRYDISKIPLESSSRPLRQVPCKVSSKLTTVGEPEINAEEWPTTLGMELIAKPCNMHQFESTFLKQSDNVIFHFSQNVESSEILSSLKEETLKGFIGCILLPKQDSDNCDVCILMLVSTDDLYTYAGFIPKDPTGLIDTYFHVMTKEQTTKKLKKTSEKLKPQKQRSFVSQHVVRPLFGLQERRSNQPSNPDMGHGSSDSNCTSRRDCDPNLRCLDCDQCREYRRPRYSIGVPTWEPYASFVPARRYSPYIHVPRLSTRPLTERQSNLSRLHQIRLSELAARKKETLVQVESVLGRQQHQAMSSIAFIEDEVMFQLDLLEQQSRMFANNTTNTNNQHLP